MGLVKEEMKNIAFSAGGALGLPYAKVLKEINKKQKWPEKVSGTSIGGIFAALVAQRETVESSKQFFTNFSGDTLSKWAADFEFKRGPLLLRVVRMIAVALLSYTRMYYSLSKDFKQMFSWDKVQSELYLCVTPVKSLIKKEVINIIENRPSSWEDALLNSTFKALNGMTLRQAIDEGIITKSVGAGKQKAIDTLVKDTESQVTFYVGEDASVGIAEELDDGTVKVPVLGDEKKYFLIKEKSNGTMGLYLK